MSRDPDPASPEYKDAVRSLRARAVAALRRARSRAERGRAIEEFIQDACRAGMVAQELIDLFCVSTPSVVEESEIPEPEIAEAVALFDELHDRARRGDRQH